MIISKHLLWFCWWLSGSELSVGWLCKTHPLHHTFVVILGPVHWDGPVGFGGKKPYHCIPEK